MSPTFEIARNRAARRSTDGRTIGPAIQALYAAERIVAAVALICLAPFLMILAVVTRLASGRAPIVAHARIGRDGEMFWVYKFRTMWPYGAAVLERSALIDKLADERPQSKLAPDHRVTGRFALFCRRHSLDELPQLFLVVCGRMSLVGPRPMTRSEFFEHYGQEASGVLSLKPGLTGLWQVRGRSRLTYRQRKRLDLFLLHHFSVAFYLLILLQTIPEVFIGRDAR